MTSKTETESEHQFWPFPKPKKPFLQKEPGLETVICTYQDDFPQEQENLLDGEMWSITAAELCNHVE